MSFTDTPIIVDFGDVLSERYEILEEVGAGAMGSVYKVKDRTLNNEIIALKVLYAQFAKEEVSLARFKNEVVLARKLGHPGILRIFDFGSLTREHFFLSMEFVEGMSLASRLYSQELPPLTFDEVLRVLYQTANALAFAHREGVVHRDLKPDNILLSDSGLVKVSDFGLARAVASGKGLTQTGETVGTPYYMSPEQLRGSTSDPKVDIYSFGILAYEMALKERPFQDENYLTLATMHMTHPFPDMRKKDKNVPAWFQSMVETCTEKDAKHRYQSFDEILVLLSNHLSQVTAKELNCAVCSTRLKASSSTSKTGLFSFLK